MIDTFRLGDRAEAVRTRAVSLKVLIVACTAVALLVTNGCEWGTPATRRHTNVLQISSGRYSVPVVVSRPQGGDPSSSKHRNAVLVVPIGLPTLRHAEITVERLVAGESETRDGREWPTILSVAAPKFLGMLDSHYDRGKEYLPAALSRLKDELNLEYSKIPIVAIGHNGDFLRWFVEGSNVEFGAYYLFPGFEPNWDSIEAIYSISGKRVLLPDTGSVGRWLDRSKDVIDSKAICLIKTNGPVSYDIDAPGVLGSIIATVADEIECDS